MAVPAFSTASAVLTSASATSATPVLPGSLVTNNVLIAYVFVKATGKSFAVSGTGWVLGDSVNAGNESGAWAWKLVTGGDVACTFTWTGAAAFAAQELQFSGNTTPTAVGAKNNQQGTGTTITIASLTTTAQNSLIYVPTQTGTSQTIPSTGASAAGYSSLGTAASGNGSLNNITGAKNTIGATQGYSETISSSDWTAFAIEILGTGSGTSNLRDTQTTHQVLESYTNVTNLRATQTTHQVLESYSNVTNLRATQTVLTVLYSLGFGTGPSAGEHWAGSYAYGLNWVPVFGGPNLNSLGNGNAILGDVPVYNGDNLDMFCDVGLLLASAAFAAPNFIGVYLYPLNQDSTTYGDGKFTAAAAGPPPDTYLVGNIGIPATTAAQFGVLSRIAIPPGTFKVLLYNQGGVAFAASGNTCWARMYNRQII